MLFNLFNGSILVKTARHLANTPRKFSTSTPRNFKVAVLGAGGGIGQPLSLLLKLNPLIHELKLYDIARVPGVVADLSHIETNCKVTGFEKCASDACQDAEVIVIPAGVPRKPGMSRDDLFASNAKTAKDLTEAIAAVNCNALIAIITNPVNVIIPIASEILRQAGQNPCTRLFGVTTLDTVRANTFVAELLKKDPKEVSVPVVGGHAGETIVPLLSRTTPCPPDLPEDKTKALIKRIQEAGTEVVKAKAGEGSATLSMAYAASRFTTSLLRGLNGESDVVEAAYVHSDVTEASFFATPLVLGKNGIEKNLGLGKLSSSEEAMVKTAIETLKKNIQKGIEFAGKK